MKRILHIQKVKYIAGSESHLLMLLPRLREYGYNSTMLVLADAEDRPGTFCERMRASGVPTEVMSMRGDIDPLLVWKLARYIRQGNFDLVHTHLFHADLYGTLAAYLSGKRIILSTRHNDNKFRNHILFKVVNRLCVCFDKKIITISNWLKKFSVDVERVPESKVETIHYGFDVNSFDKKAKKSLPTEVRKEFNISSDQQVLGIVARLTEQKGHKDLLQAFRAVIDRYPQTILLIVGDGELEKDLKTQVQNMGLKEQVIFTGYREDIPAIMQAIDIFVHPSLWEGFGLVFLEAMAAGKPVVATRVSAIPEIVVDGETGYLVPPKNSHLLTEKILQLLENRVSAYKMGEKGRERLGQYFTVEKMVKEIKKLYDELLYSQGENLP